MRLRGHGLITAPSIKTPALAYFQSATTSLRASAVIITFLKRPPFCATRSLNQRLSVDEGWCLSQSQAISNNVDRSRGFHSRSMAPVSVRNRSRSPRRQSRRGRSLLADPVSGLIDGDPGLDQEAIHQARDWDASMDLPPTNNDRADAGLVVALDA
jgi:hypothetical protein